MSVLVVLPEGPAEAAFVFTFEQGTTFGTFSETIFGFGTLFGDFLVTVLVDLNALAVLFSCRGYEGLIVGADDRLLAIGEQ